MTTNTQTPLEEWAHRAAQELAQITTLVDWRSESKRIIRGPGEWDMIGYEWEHWHKQQDEGRAAGERIVMLFDEYRKLTDRAQG